MFPVNVVRWSTNWNPWSGWLLHFFSQQLNGLQLLSGVCRRAAWAKCATNALTKIECLKDEHSHVALLLHIFIFQSYLSVLRAVWKWLGLYQAEQGWFWFPDQLDWLSWTRRLLFWSHSCSPCHWWCPGCCGLCLWWELVATCRCMLYRNSRLVLQ